jgi:hypothetical protein
MGGYFVQFRKDIRLNRALPRCDHGDGSPYRFDARKRTNPAVDTQPSRTSVRPRRAGAHVSNSPAAYPAIMTPTQGTIGYRDPTMRLGPM